MLTAAAGQLTATVGTGETRQQQPAARVGVRSTVEATPRAPEVLADVLGAPAAARARRQRAGTREEAPRAQPVRRVARLGRPKPAGLEGLQADAARREPQHRQPVVVRRDGARCRWRLATQRCKPWTRVPVVLDIRPGVGSRWRAANAWFGAASRAGTHWGPQQLTALLRGRVGYGIGGLRQILTKPPRRKSGRETLQTSMPFFHNHRRWRPYDASLAMGLPVGTGVVESACGAVVTHRMAGEGQRWSVAGAEVMRAWRSLKQSHDHDRRAYWRFRAGQVRVRLDASKPKYRPTARWRRVA
jgi:hypothetical protein